MREWLVGPENMRASFSRRFEDHEEHHRPPIPHEGWYRNRNAVGRIGVKARMRLDFDRQPLFDLHVEKELIRIKLFAEGPERRPLPAIVGSRPEIAVEQEAPLFCAHAQLVVVWVDHLEAILRGLREGNAMPCIFMRAVDAGLGFAGPARNFELSSARTQPFLACHFCADLQTGFNAISQTHSSFAARPAPLRSYHAGAFRGR